MKIRGDIKLGADPYSGDSSVIELGTWASPLLTAVGTHVPLSFVTTFTVAGDGVGAYFGVKGGNLAGNLNLRGLRAKAAVLAGINIGNGAIDGVYTEVEVAAGGITTGVVVGERIEVFCPVGAVLGSDVYGIYVSNYLDVDPVGENGLMRLEHNGPAILDSVILAACGAGDALCFLSITSPAAKTAWNSLGDKVGGALPNANAAGFLKVVFSGFAPGGDRYIQLYT